VNEHRLEPTRPAPARGDAWRLGIDGGGTRCRARLVDAQGRLAGEGIGGPANITLGVELVRDSVMQATRAALACAGLDDSALANTDAGLGLAAANVPAHRQAFEQVPLPFRSAAVLSDAEVACLGAHAGGEGGILILGTGSQAVVHRQGRFMAVGGWGLAISDSGSGALLGRAAVRRALLAHEGVEPASALTREVMQRFGNEPASMVGWAAGARPREWAEFAPLVFAHAARADEVALQLVQASAHAAERVLERMVALGARRICLMGGVAAPMRPYLSERVAAMLCEPRGDAMDGALLLAARGAPAARSASA
jgi:glucosamine kinase